MCMLQLINFHMLYFQLFVNGKRFFRRKDMNPGTIKKFAVKGGVKVTEMTVM